MDLTTQILLTILVIVLGITLTVIGVQLFFVLRELRQSIHRANLILAQAQKISQAVSAGTERVSQALSGLTSPAGSKTPTLLSFLAGLLTFKSLLGKLRNEHLSQEDNNDE